MGSLGTEKKFQGYVEWNPQTKTRYWMQAVNEVLDAYKAYWPLTIRQIFYRLVANYEYDKTEQAYGRLINYLGRARRAQIVPFNAIRDDGAIARGPHAYEDVDDFLSMVRSEADKFTLQRMDTQPINLEIFCEAAGMVPLLANAVSQYGVNVYSGGGFNSLTTVRRTAERIRLDKRPSIILNFGDYDPSGESIFDSFRQDVEAFTLQLGGSLPDFRRMALTEDQVYDMGIPTAPPKSSDSRSKNWEGDTAQLEAIPPDELSQMALQAVEDEVDEDIYSETLERELRIRSKLDPLVENMFDDVAGYEGYPEEDDE
jgi:hypothetical protein